MIKIIYIISFIIILLSGIGLIVIENEKALGLEALENVGNFIVLGIIFIISTLFFISVSIVFYIRKRNKKSKWDVNN